MAADASLLEAQLRQCREELAAKQAKVASLKDLMRRSLRAEKRREQQIEALQLDADERAREIRSLAQAIEERSAAAARQGERIARLELDLTELAGRVRSGAGSDAAQRRGERMRQMVERSSALYAELQTRHRQVCADLEAERARAARPGAPARAIVLSDRETVVLLDNGTFALRETRERAPAPAVHDGRAARAPRPGLLRAYLRGVLLEFFVADGAAQHRMIPVILALLDCPAEQIAAAQRGFAEGKQIIARAAAALGL